MLSVVSMCLWQLKDEFEAAMTHAYLGPHVEEDELPWALEVRVMPHG